MHASLSNREGRKGTIPSGEEEVPKGTLGGRGETRGKVEQDETVFRSRIDFIWTRQPSFDPSPAHADCAEVYMWGA